MKIGSIIITVSVLFSVTVWADSGDWGENITKDNNNVFEKVKIKNRSKKVYEDKVYKYITGDYKVENNNIELANIYLDDKLKNNDVKINILAEDLKVEGDSYKDSINLKRNQYKNFVQHDEKGIEFSPQDDMNQQSKEDDNEYTELGSNIQSTDSRYSKVPEEDVSELETIDLRGKNKIKDVNVYIKDVDILVH